MATPRNARPGMLLDPGAPINNGLVGWWPMWEGAGGKTLDISGKNNHGTLTNGPLWAGCGLIFDGTNDYVDVGDVELSNTAISVMGVAIPRAIGVNNCIVSKYEATTSARSYLLYATTSNTYTFSISDNGLSGAGALVSANSTTLQQVGVQCTVVGTFDGVGTVRLFINGVLEGATTDAGVIGIFNGARSLRLGNYESAGEKYLNGSLQGVRIWNRALSALEAQQLAINPNIGLWVPGITRYYIPAAGGGFQPAWAANSNVLLGGGMAL